MTIHDAARRAAGALGALAIAGVMGVTGCNDFLQGGELSKDPVRSTEATNKQLFVGVQTNLWSQMASDPARITGLWMQQWEGLQSQYYSAYTYSVNEQTTNGFHSAVYAGGGLKDVRQLQANAREQGDTLFLGIAKIQEAMLIGQAADMFGDVVYSQALQGPNPTLDSQLQVYDQVQVLLNDAIKNLASFTSSTTNLGPGSSDLNYSGNKAKWTALANTLKARYFLHTAEVRPAAYDSALKYSRLGITNPANNWNAVFSGAGGETNFWFQFQYEQRYGYMAADPFFLSFLRAHGNDPREEAYFDVDEENCDAYYCVSPTRLDPAFTQPLVTAQENLLIQSEAAYRTGNPGEAVTALHAEETIEDVPLATAATGSALLKAILDEKYIALFQTLEPWNDYKRTCYPNLTPTAAGQKIPARFYYDTGERQTNKNIPAAQSQPTRNANDPANAQDPFGNACKGQ